MVCVFDILRQWSMLIIYLGCHVSESKDDFGWSNNFPLVKITPIGLEITELSPCVGVVIGKRHVLCGSTATCVPNEMKNYNDLRFLIEFEGKTYHSVSVKNVEDYRRESDYPDLSLIEVDEDIPKSALSLPINTGAIIQHCQLIYWSKPNQTTAKEVLVYPHKYCFNEWNLTPNVTQICAGWISNENGNKTDEGETGSKTKGFLRRKEEIEKNGEERRMRKREVEESEIKEVTVARGDIKGEDEEALVVEDDNEDERSKESKERKNIPENGIEEAVILEPNEEIKPVEKVSVEKHAEDGKVNENEEKNDTDSKAITIEDSHLYWGVQGFPLICKGALTALKWSDTAFVVNKGRVRLDLYTRLKDFAPWLREHVPDLNEVALESKYEKLVSDDYGNYVDLQGGRGTNLERQIYLIVSALMFQLWEFP